MIIYDRQNVSGFARRNATVWPGQPIALRWITVTSGAPVVVVPPSFTSPALQGRQRAAASVVGRDQSATSVKGLDPSDPNLKGRT